MAKRIIFAYKKEGFSHTGGLQRIAIEAVNYLRRNTSNLEIVTCCDSPDGIIPGTVSCRKLLKGDVLIIVGCNIPWAYKLAIWARIRGLSVAWMPSFHDPISSIHYYKARAAQAFLRAIQGIGVVVYAQTDHEVNLLRGVQGSHNCHLSSHGLPHQLQLKLLEEQKLLSQDAGQYAMANYTDRPIDLLYLGRPTNQKGWSKYESLARYTSLRCEAIVPFLPSNHSQTEIKLHLEIKDADVQLLLNKAKLVVIPSNYESFGIAQIEAVLAGCVVPILGHWPIWNAFHELRWNPNNPIQLAYQCEKLCRNPELLEAVHQRQIIYLSSHPIIHITPLPNLI